MKTGSLLLAVTAMLMLGACGPVDAPAPDVAAEDLGQSTAELHTCTNSCSSTGGSAISCTGNACSSESNYVVCDGQYTYCQQPPPPGPCADFTLRCPGSSTILRCPTTTQVCMEWTSCSIRCDGVERRCPTPGGTVCPLK
ncbi:hypothetical protein A176_001817 [Myxococcus hansupus]|uniref:Lipoprotein n=1 Tax=Pseudomyxococcus hansupus TaxID=1297742 RepID=A0A0H4WUB8_9BACT|nr:hypothetical protein [Myxococcus hansupus]AKQ64905.1 hypothetical protein A176_001817 [Myxococcus hansupus]